MQRCNTTSEKIFYGLFLLFAFFLQVFDQKQQLEETRKIRDESREELSRWQQTWARERSELAHKLRQEEKVQQAEHQALQLKYESRIKVMEDSSKRFQTQVIYG